METCILIPRELSVVLKPSGRPRRLLEMEATLWTNRTLHSGTVLLPDDGELRLDLLELFSDLSEFDVRRQYGCVDQVQRVDRRDVRHCNWVRFLQATSVMDCVNVVACRVDCRPQFHVIRQLPPNAELKVYFEELTRRRDIIDTLAGVCERSVAADMLDISAALDLSFRDTVSYNASSSGFDSPSMHADRRDEPAVCDGSTGSGACSDHNAVVLASVHDVMPADKHEILSVLPTQSDNIAGRMSSAVDDDDDDDDDEAFVDDCSAADSAAALSRDDDDPRAPVVDTTPQQAPPLLLRRREKTWLPCDFCGKTFDRPSLLKRHMRTHTGEKPHVCDVCLKAFSTSSSLNTHRRIHFGEKPHQCTTCGKRFTASSNLYYHRMTHNKEKPHKCSLCNKSFPTPGDLKSHMYVHNGSWPYRCETCNRGFSKQANLRNHVLLHTGDKPHQCSQCGKKFTLLCNWRTHLKSHEDSQCVRCHQTIAMSSTSIAGDSTPRLCVQCVTSRDRLVAFSIDSLIVRNDESSSVYGRNRDSELQSLYQTPQYSTRVAASAQYLQSLALLPTAARTSPRSGQLAPNTHLRLGDKFCI